MTDRAKIPGYTYGTGAVPRSPVTLAEFELMKKSVLFGDEDAKYLRLSHEVVKDQVEAILDVWYGFVGSNPHLLASFTGKSDGKPISDYLDAVRKRFEQWILETSRADYDQKWLDYQHEIGLRHHRAKKNRTDGAATTPHIPLRYMISSIAPISLSMKPFLAAKGHAVDDVEAMFAAWCKVVALQVALWSRPYASEADF
jgi:Protoglobin